MTDVPPQAPPAAPPGAVTDPLEAFDLDRSFDEQLIERWGNDGRDPVVPFVNAFTGTVRVHGRRLDQHDQEIGAIRNWGTGVDAFGQQQLALNATMTQSVVHAARRQTHLERHISGSQVAELIASIGIGLGLVAFVLWINTHDVIGGVVVSHTLAVWVAIAIAVVFTIISLIIGIRWFRPLADEPAVPQRDQHAPPTEVLHAVPADEPPIPTPIGDDAVRRP